MKRTLSAIAACCLLASVYADDTKIEVKVEKTAARTCTEGCSQGCPIEAAMAKLPKMSYVVGKEEVCCPTAAASLAKKDSAAIKYMVAKKTFETKTDAMVALADATEKFVAEYVTTKHCSVSNKYTVAGKEVCCSVMAGKRAELAKAAMKKVQMTYVVGEKTCNCPNEAAAIAKKTGVEKQFVVAGKKTCCSVDARIKLAQAKYKAMVQALAKADAPAKVEVKKG